MSIIESTIRGMLPEKVVSRLPIWVKVTIATSLISLIGLGALWLIVSSTLNQLVRNQEDTFGTLLVQQTANSSAELILAEDLLSLNVITNKVAEASNVFSVIIFDREGKILAQSGNAAELSLFQNLLLRISESPEGEITTIREKNIYATPIFIQDVRAGYAVVLLDPSTVTATISQAVRWTAMATLVLILLSILLSAVLGKNLTNPIRRLMTATTAIRSGNLDYRISENRHDEIGDLIESFNHMAQGLKEKDQLSDTFKKYVPNNVASTLLNDLSRPLIPTNYVNASVLFIDIVSFTSMSENMTPEAVGKLLNNAYRLILKASSPYHGTVDKFIGDGAMIVFGAPDQDEDHSFNAICCAQLFLGLVEKHNQQQEIDGLPQIQFRLGLHCGEMLAGTLGTQERMQYTVVGDTVNLAARLCHCSDPGKLTVSESVHQQAHGDERIITEDKKSVQVRGKKKEIITYQVNDLCEPYRNQVQFRINQITALGMEQEKETSESNPGFEHVG